MKILIAEPKDFSEKSLSKLEALGTVIQGPFTKEELFKSISDVSVLVLRLKHLIDKELLEQAKNLEYILTPTTGLNHIDTVACRARGVKVLSLYGESEFLSSIPSTCEHTWALLLSLLRKVPEAFNAIKNDTWNRDDFRSHNLNALSLGVLGLGRVGKQVVKIANAFNMKVYGFDIAKIDPIENVILVDSVKELMEVSDILSIHVNLTDANKNLINKDNLRYAKQGMYIINTSRGELINENDLVFYLNSARLRGVAVDVLDKELNNKERNLSPLLAYSKENNNVIITPHIAGATIESMQMTEDFIVAKLFEELKTL